MKDYHELGYPEHWPAASPWKHSLEHLQAETKPADRPTDSLAQCLMCSEPKQSMLYTDPTTRYTPLLHSSLKAFLLLKTYCPSSTLFKDLSTNANALFLCMVFSVSIISVLIVPFRF